MYINIYEGYGGGIGGVMVRDRKKRYNIILPSFPVINGNTDKRTRVRKLERSRKIVRFMYILLHIFAVHFYFYRL